MLQEDSARKDILELSCTEFTYTIEAGERAEGQFSIHAGSYIYGEIFSSDTRVRNIQRSFESNSTINVKIDGTNLLAGQEIKGEFCIISNIGEYTLPFIINVAFPVLNSSQGEIKNLFHFTNLAQLSWNEAVNLFYDPNFESIFGKKDHQYLSLYRGYSKFPGNESNVEEFLIAINKKLPVDYQLDTDGVILENVYSSIHEYIHVKKSGWGYSHFDVDKTGDFFTLSHIEINNNDFENNICTLDFFVDAAKLKPGTNVGSITIHNTITNLCIPVKIWMGDEDKNKKHSRKNSLDFQRSVIDLYAKSKLGNTTIKDNLEEAKDIIEEWLEYDEEAIFPQLYKVQLLLTKERFNEAQWLLEEVGNRLRKEEADIIIKGYYYYLTTLYNRDEVYLQNVINALENALYKNKKNWQLAILLIYINEEYSKNPEKKWNLLKEQYDNDCTSPILYGEALSVIAENPSMLLRIEKFELQVLWFGIKNNILSRELQEHVIYLASRASEYSNLLFGILSSIYEKSPSDQLLNVICRLLILGDKRQNEYFNWYKLGVDKQLRVTGLYEYFMYSLKKDESAVIPRIVLLYFSYQSQLNVEDTAFLYRYVAEHSEEEPEIANTYESVIERFVIDQIKARRISRDLAFLYENVVVAQMLRDESAYSFTPLLFSHEIIVENKKIKSVTLIQERMKGESTFPVENGRCLIPIYTEDYVLFLQDDFGNRFSKSVTFKNVKLMNHEEMIPDLKACLQGRPSFDFYECENEHDAITVNKRNFERYRRLADSVLIDDTLKSELRTKLLRFYYDDDRIGELDAFLDEVDDTELDFNERSEFMRFLISRGKFDKSYIWLKKYGASGINQKNIARLVSKRIQSTEYMEDEFLINVAFYVFRKAKYDEATLIYLAKYYRGKVRDLRDIWSAAEELSLPCKEVKEKILRQMMVTNELVQDKNDILLSYEQEDEPDETLIEQYYERIASDYFLKNVLVENVVLDALYERYKKNSTSVSMLQKMSLLKYWSEGEKNRQNIPPETINELMMELYEQNIYFAFFKELSKYSPKLHYMQDRFYIEYHANSKGRVKLHYLYDESVSLNANIADDENFKVEEMTEIYEGIFVKECNMFSGEILQYYISEEIDGEEVITFSNSIHCGLENTQDEYGRFSKLNDVVISLELSDDAAAKKMLEDYLHEDYCARELFMII